MRLATFQAPGQDGPQAGIVDGDRVRAFGGPDGVRQALAIGEAPAPSGDEWALDEVTLLAPVPPLQLAAHQDPYLEQSDSPFVAASVPPTAPNARTGELTPPGARVSARRNSSSLRSRLTVTAVLP